MKKLLFIFALMCGAMFTSWAADSVVVDTLALDSVQ